jgi:hypothetical protein
MSIIYEARCTKCDELFNPADEEDLIHVEQEDGTPCEGQGILMGSWHFGNNQ